MTPTARFWICACARGQKQHPRREAQWAALGRQASALQPSRLAAVSAVLTLDPREQGCTSLPSSSRCGGFSMTTVCTALPGCTDVAPCAVPEAPCPAHVHICQVVPMITAEGQLPKL